MNEPITYVGIDAHKKDLAIAMLSGDEVAPTTWTVPNEPAAVRRLVRKLERATPGPIRACYEAGPCGYALQRRLTTTRVACAVIAPALIPRKPGERIKTDRRDARKLAELWRAGLLTEVRPPTPADEAVRDLCRARDDARADRQRGRHRMGKLLLRRGLHYGGRNWTQAHRRWIDSLTWEHAAERVVVDDYLLAIDHLDARLGELDAQLTAIAATAPYQDAVGWLRCFRGIETLTAMMMLAELHDFRRFQAPRALMAYLGLVPGEHSSGEKHRRGRITKTGNTLVRRLLVETAWHYRHRARGGTRWRGAGAANRDASSRSRTRRNSGCVGASVPSPAGRCPPRRSRWRSRANWPASCGRRCSPSQPRRTTDTRGRVDARCAGAGPRGRRMIRGTSVRTGDYTMRYGRVSQRALLDCTSSRRSMVMRALPRLGVVTTEYQDDSSSKRPRSSAVFAATSRWTERVPRVGWGLQGCAPTGRRLRRPWIPRPTRSEGE